MYMYTYRFVSIAHTNKCDIQRFCGDLWVIQRCNLKAHKTSCKTDAENVKVNLTNFHLTCTCTCVKRQCVRMYSPTFMYMYMQVRGVSVHALF